MKNTILYVLMQQIFTNIILLSIIFLLFYVIIKFIKLALYNDAPFLPLPESKIQKVIDALNLSDHDILYDLGSGDGRILKKAHERNSKTSLFGVEYDYFPYVLSLLRLRHAVRQKKVTLIYGNMFDADLSNATVIFVYLFPKPMNRLYEKFRKELKQGTRVVSCDFRFNSMEPDKIINIDSNIMRTASNLYLYTF